MSKTRDNFSDLDSDPQLKGLLDGFVFVGGSCILFGAALPLGSGWSLHRGGEFWWNLVLAAIMFPGWIVLTWVRLKHLRRSRLWTILIYPQPVAIALCASTQQPILARIVGAVALATVLFLVFLKPSSPQ